MYQSDRYNLLKDQYHIIKTIYTILMTYNCDNKLLRHASDGVIILKLHRQSGQSILPTIATVSLRLWKG